MNYSKDTIQILPNPTHPNFKNRTGQVFGKLTFLGIAGRNEKDQPVWFIECDCGEIFISHSTCIVEGKKIQCHPCNLRMKATRATTHGMRHTPEYETFYHAKYRCTKPTDSRYSDYGGRGIEFRFDTFEEFFAELGLRPSASHSVNRIDNNGHYEKGNVEWATKDTQANNTRANKFWTYQGKTQTHIQWCREFGLKHPTLIQRLKSGWSEEKAFLTPTRPIRNSSGSIE